MKVKDYDVLAWVWGQRKMSHVLGAFGLLDFTMLRPILVWHAFWNLWTDYFFNFRICFRAAVNRGYWISEYEGTTLLRLWTKTKYVIHSNQDTTGMSACYGPFLLGARFENFFNFPISFRAAVNRGYWISEYGGTTVLRLWTKTKHHVHSNQDTAGMIRSWTKCYQAF
jgi:hypothetical protein